MVNICNKNIKLNSFTHWNIACLLYNIYYKNFTIFYCINCCWTWSIFVTFHSGVIYDNYTFVKIRKKINCGFIEFHSGNFILHTLPCIYIYYKPPLIILTDKHALFALLIKFIWIYISTYGSMDLSLIYVKFSNSTVRNLYTTSIISTLSIPFFYNYFYVIK